MARLPGVAPYARIDMAATPSGQLLLEAELHEAGLLFQYVPAGAARFADATLAWIGPS